MADKKRTIELVQMPEDLEASQMASGSMRPEQDVSAQEAEDRVAAAKKAAVAKAAEKIAIKMDEMGYPETGAKAAALAEAMGNAMPSTPREVLLMAVPAAMAINARRAVGAREAAKAKWAADEGARVADIQRRVRIPGSPELKAIRAEEDMERARAIGRKSDVAIRETGEDSTKSIKTMNETRPRVIKVVGESEGGSSGRLKELGDKMAGGKEVSSEEAAEYLALVKGKKPAVAAVKVKSKVALPTEEDNLIASLQEMFRGRDAKALNKTKPSKK